jgi:hypothetical protein
MAPSDDVMTEPPREGEPGDDQGDPDQQTGEQGRVGGHGAGGDRPALLLGERTGQGQHQHDGQEPAGGHRQGERQVQVGLVGGEPGERRTVVVRRRGEGVHHLGQPVRALGEQGVTADR